MEKSIEEMPKIFHSGYGYIPKSVMRSKNISIQAKAIYAYLISFAGRKLEAYPSRKLMCYDLNVSQDTLNKYLKELIEQKLISKTQRRKERKFTNNVYYFNYEIEPEILLTDKSVTEKINSNLTEKSITEKSGNFIIDNEQMVTNINKENNNNINTNGNTKSNNNSNNNYKINKESNYSLQELKSITNKYIHSPELIKAFNEFLDFRQAIHKPVLTEIQLKKMVELLNTCEDIEDAINCIDYSIRNNYQDLYTDYKTFPVTKKTCKLSDDEIKEFFGEEWI